MNPTNMYNESNALPYSEHNPDPEGRLQAAEDERVERSATKGKSDSTSETDKMSDTLENVVRRFTNAAMPTQVVVSGIELVDAGFARQLERELNQAHQLLFDARWHCVDQTTKDKINDFLLKKS